MKTTFKFALCGIFCALAIVSFVIENLFPPIIFAGARIGVSNIFILITLIVIGEGYAFIVLILKTILGSLFAGNISMIIYSLPAGAIALLLEIILLKVIQTSIISASTAGAVLNVTIQNLIFALITNTVQVLYYLPYLALIATLSGLTVGLATTITVKRLPRKIIEEKEENLYNGEKEF